MMEGWRSWRIRSALRRIVIVGTTFGLMLLGLKGMNGGERNTFTSKPVKIGAIAVGVRLAGQWAEPK
jgi:hypothetical protein